MNGGRRSARALLELLDGAIALGACAWGGEEAQQRNNSIEHPLEAMQRSVRPHAEAWSPREQGEVAAAAQLAGSAHAGATRKATLAPYASHPLAVAAIAAWHGAKPATIVAALLHDVIEDAPPQFTERLVREHPQAVALVRAVSAAPSADGWRARRRAELRRMQSYDEQSALLKACDVLHNAHQTRAVLTALGPRMGWKALGMGRGSTLWWISQAAGALQTRAHAMSRLIKRARDDIETMG